MLHTKARPATLSDSQRRRSRVCLYPCLFPFIFSGSLHSKINQTLLNGSATKHFACTACLRSIFRVNSRGNQESISLAMARENTLSLILEHGHGFRGTLRLALPRKKWSLFLIFWSGSPELRSDRLSRGGLEGLTSRKIRLQEWWEQEVNSGAAGALRMVMADKNAFENASYIMTAVHILWHIWYICIGELIRIWLRIKARTNVLGQLHIYHGYSPFLCSSFPLYISHLSPPGKFSIQYSRVTVLTIIESSCLYSRVVF